MSIEDIKERTKRRVCHYPDRHENCASKDSALFLSALEAIEELHRKVSIYDECECPEGTHPEDYDYTDCQDYAGCANSITGIGCEECCVYGDYLTEACGEGHNHTMDPAQRCGTVRALTEALR